MSQNENNEHEEVHAGTVDDQQPGREYYMHPSFCKEAVHRAVEGLGRLGCMILNAAEQHPVADIADISAEQLERTFRTNIFSHFYLTKAALDHLHVGSTIITCSSVNAYRGHDSLIDQSSDVLQP